MEKSRKKIIEIISSTRPSGYDWEIRGSGDAELSYALSSVRNGLFSWLPSDSSFDVLVTDWKYGAGLESLSAHVGRIWLVEKDPELRKALKIRFEGTNVTVTDAVPEGKMDIIITGDPDAEWYDIRQTAAEHACIYVCFNNPNGYSAGGADCGSTKMSTEEHVKEKLERIGFKNTVCYYPLPGELFPQAIYSDIMPADSTVTDRVFVIDPNEISRARTNDVFEKRVREGTLLQMAPFVILAAARSVEDLPRAGKVILSIDRDRHNCFQVIFSDNIVIKQNIYPEGRKKLEQMHDNICEMGSRGIRVIKEELSDTGISMDNFGPDNLLAFLVKHPERTEEMLDMILKDVLNSSDTFTDAGKLILKKGYTDMTPFNCYYDGTRLVYFDQEFTKEDCPVSYVMFRAVKYLYIHIEGLEQFVKQSYLYDKYSITEDLESFEGMEYRFVSSLRRMDVFSQFWNWRT